MPDQLEEKCESLKQAFNEAIINNDLLRIALLVRTTPEGFYEVDGPLAKAAFWARTNIVEFFLQEKVDLNGIDFALYSASQSPDSNAVKVMELLIENGADVNWLSPTGNASCLTLPCAKGDVKRVKLLLDAGADPNFREYQDWRAIMHATQANQKEVIKLLIERKADVNAQNVLGRTALMYASLNGYTEIVKLLLEGGADPNIRDKNNKVAEDYARVGYWKHIRRMLAEYQGA